MSKEDARRQGIQDAMAGKNDPIGTDFFEELAKYVTFGEMDSSRSPEEQEAYKQGQNEVTLANIASGNKK